MDETMFTIFENKLDKIIKLLENIQPKPKRLKQTKIINQMTLEEQIQPYQNIYSPLMIKKFISYWGENDYWKKQKTWEIGRRLERWNMNEDQRNYENSQRLQLKNVNEMPRRKSEERVDSGFTKITFN